MGNSIPRELVLCVIDNYRMQSRSVTKIIKTYVLDDYKGPAIITEQVIVLELTSDHDAIIAAKNLRLVCKDIADTYGPRYIHKHIGGDFGRKQHCDVIRNEMLVWYDYLLPICAGIQVQRTLNEYGDLYFKKARGYNILNRYDHIITAITSIVQNPSLIYDDDYMSELISDRRWCLYYTQNVDGEGSYTYVVSDGQLELKMIMPKYINITTFSLNPVTYKPSGSRNISRVSSIHDIHG